MGKTSRRRKQKQHRIFAAGIIFAAAVFCIAMVLMLLAHCGLLPLNRSEDPDTFYDQIEMKQLDTEQLGFDLELLGVGRYAGLFLEDGTNASVSDVLMIKIKNTGDKDLQLARLSMTYSDFTAEFEITNLPVGRTVVVLEKNRHPYTNQKHLNVALSDVVYFEEQMDVCDQTYEITGLRGALNLKNCSGTDISGDIYVYYKYIAEDELYGGITFRAKIAGGLPAGEIRQVMTSHFDPDHCIILSINAGE